MKPNDDNLNRLDDLQIDMLVDGALSEPERHELLTRLEHTPGGWRRCALAFLEAQCWKGAFRGETGPASAAATPASAQRPARGIQGQTLLAMAASFLVALGLGVYARGLFPAGDDTVPGATDVAQSTSRPGEPAHELPSPPSRGPWQMVTLPVAASAEGQPIRLPCREDDQMGADWENAPPAIPRDLVEALRRAGHQVEEQREVIPLEMRDGRRVMVPVDQIELRYTGRHGLQ